ncbi:unnamed protein product [Schistosoma mattheei]|uniref:Kinesin motor domain-containing protein n=1 Tax=Schistosoma mattheei TaxID=31246 RepID=A0AA85BLL1_9TREM|nr:unnamed protein product [Schistosoma mattheei]
MGIGDTSVKVGVRVRPLSDSEVNDGSSTCLSYPNEENQLIIGNDRLFGFDYVFKETDSQEHVYKKAALPMVENILKGYNATLFAYGQTGSGKHIQWVHVSPKDLFEKMPNYEYEYTVKVSFLEIYKEDIHDLLGEDVSASLQIREENQLVKITEMDGENTGGTLTVKLHLVDLAGSERIKKTHAEGDRLKEGIDINRGLLALGNVISALCERDAKKRSHIPYRDPRLTRLLQDSLGGNSTTLMLACVSPADINMEETLNTLRYADRARLIKNKPILNRADPKDAELAKLRVLVAQLQARLANELVTNLMNKNKKLENSPFTTDDEFKNVEAECSLPFTVVTDINMKDVQSRLQAANENIDQLKIENAQLRDASKIQHDKLLTIRSLITNSPFTTDDEFKNVEAECSLPFTVVTDINSKSNADSHTHRCKCRGTCQARCSCRRSGRPCVPLRCYCISGVCKNRLDSSSQDSQIVMGPPSGLPVILRPKRKTRALQLNKISN